MSAAFKVPTPPRRPPVQIAKITNGPAETVRFRLVEDHGRQMLDARVFDRGEFPTKQGWSVPIEQLHEVLAALVTAEAEVRRRGLIKGEGP